MRVGGVGGSKSVVNCDGNGLGDCLNAPGGRCFSGFVRRHLVCFGVFFSLIVSFVRRVVPEYANLSW